LKMLEYGWDEEFGGLLQLILIKAD